MVEVPGHAQLHIILHQWVMLHPHEVEVPRCVIWNLIGGKTSKLVLKQCDLMQKRGFEVCLNKYTYHIEPKEAVTQKHLDLLIMSREVSMRVAPVVLVAASPLVTAWCQLICSQRARSWREAACQNDALLTIPLFVALQNLCM